MIFFRFGNLYKKSCDAFGPNCVYSCGPPMLTSGQADKEL